MFCGVLQCVAVCCMSSSCRLSQFSRRMSKKTHTPPTFHPILPSKRKIGGIRNMFRIHSEWRVCQGIFSVLPCVAVCCSMLQCVAVCCNVLQCVAVCCRSSRYLAWHTLCCSVLHCVAVCCSVLRCVAKKLTHTLSPHFNFEKEKLEEFGICFVSTVNREYARVFSVCGD